MNTEIDTGTLTQPQKLINTIRKKQHKNYKYLDVKKTRNLLVSLMVRNNYTALVFYRGNVGTPIDFDNTEYGGVGSRE